MPKPTSAHSRDLVLLENLWRESDRLRYTLPNGLTVLLQRDAAAPVSSVQVWVKTGSIHEGGALGAGLSHCLEHTLLFKEHHALRQPPRFPRPMQAHGGYINAYTTFDRTVYYIDRCPASYRGCRPRPARRRHAALGPPGGGSDQGEGRHPARDRHVP